jgi:phosphoglycerate dehydrogenase-like enzyme
MSTKTIYVGVSDFTPACVEQMRSAGYDVTVRDAEKPVSRIELRTLATRFDAVIVGDAEPVTEELASALPRMRVLGTLALHLAHIDLEAMNWAGIRVVNAAAVEDVGTRATGSAGRQSSYAADEMAAVLTRRVLDALSGANIEV